MNLLAISAYKGHGQNLMVNHKDCIYKYGAEDKPLFTDYDTNESVIDKANNCIHDVLYFEGSKATMKQSINQGD